MILFYFYMCPRNMSKVKAEEKINGMDKAWLRWTMEQDH